MFFSIINKIIVLGILILIVPTYGNPNTHLKTRNSKVNSENTPFKDFVVEYEGIFAYILKEDYQEDNACEKKINEYCKELRDIDTELNKVYIKVKEICDNIKQKCENIKAKIQKKVGQIGTLIDDLAKKIPFYRECEQYYQECMFFEPTKDEAVISSCIFLRDNCYLYKQKQIRNEVVLRALGADIIKSEDFEGKKREICPILTRQGDDLVSLCLEDILFEDFNKDIDSFCGSLTFFNINTRKEEVCHEKLGVYPLLKERCEKINNKFKGLCEGKNITYRPPVKDFNPIDPEMTLLEKIDLENLYKEGRNRGLILGALEKTLDDMLIRLSSSTKPDVMENNCKNVLEKKCGYLKTISSEFKELCEKNKIGEKCKDILDLTDKCKKLRIRLYLDGTSTEFKDIKSKHLSYDKLSTLFNENECLQVISECTYIKGSCESDTNYECQNLRLACYKKKEDQLFIKLIGSELYKLNKLESNDEKFNKCQRIVLEKCATLNNNNIEIFMRCLRPKEICLRFEKIISSQLKDLEQVLNEVRDSPKEKDCIKLKEDCEGILKDLGLNNGKCVTLKERCEYFKVTRELKYAFLKEKSDALADNEKCMKALKDKCDKLPKVMGGGGYIMFHALYQKKHNLEKHEIVNKTKNVNKTLVEETCVLWDPYCDQLMENCPETLKNDSSSADGKGVCLQLKENCEPFWKKKQLEDGLTHELKGSLNKKDECKVALGERCARWKDASNQTFNDLLGNCNDTTKGDVCEKLVEKVQKRCQTLKDNLEKVKKELTEKKNDYIKAKDAAEKSMEVAKLLLSMPRQTVTPSAQNSNVSTPVPPPPESGPSSGSPSSPERPLQPLKVELPSSLGGTSDTSSEKQSTPDETQGTTGKTTKYAKLGLVKREYVAEGIPEAEVKAFNETAIALELYLELKEECKPLQLDCGFRKDCPQLRVCEEIDILCELEPLKVAPHRTERIEVTMTETKTIEKTTETITEKTSTETITITESVTREKVTEPCTVVQTTDIWVTRTSLHTSTITSTSMVMSTVTSTVTLTSMQKCKPTKCTTDSNKETQKEEEEVKPNDGMKIRVPDMIKIMLLGVIVMGMM
ncbi:hypothetical protein T552_00005 [Pneumocystis carinii B80]|uniref:Major surface glycoprotein 2 C-terminal domain-containing protein n=1 Tax=Pneumocystis carinii (strain B80) TaxID=1408658 RepID=A0A0W4ZSM3_PNEC8|nr:hypothetical protein T552_00005 [Pneumocystis carinii B80]KTW31360.1 hypothetical protein T552_00005 [Pneumocystis carinii B80]